MTIEIINDFCAIGSVGREGGGGEGSEELKRTRAGLSNQEGQALKIVEIRYFLF